MKTFIAMIPFTFAFIANPLAAQEVTACNDDTLNRVIEQVAAAPEGTKEMAMAELQLAKEKMAEGDADACAIHLANASIAATGS